MPNNFAASLGVKMPFHEVRTWGYLPCLLDVPRNSQQSAFAGLLSCSPCYCTKVSNR